MNEPDPTVEDMGRRAKAAMQAEYGTFAASDGWTAIVDRLDRRPSIWHWLGQRPLLVGAAAIVVALLAVLTVTLITGDGGEDLNMVDDPDRPLPAPTTIPTTAVPTTAPTPTTLDAPTTTAPTTTTTALPPPPALVYVTWRGEVFRQTIGGGTELITTLPELPGLPLDGLHQVVTSHRLAPTPDGSTVYLSRPVSLEDGCQRMLYAVSLQDGAVTELGRGDTPAVSPDGTKLAYFDTHEELTEFAQGCPSELVVRDLESGAERRWRDVESYDPNAYGGYFDLQWAPDNRTVVVDHGYESSAVLTADTAAPEGDLSLSRLGIDQLPRYPDGPEFYSLVGVTQMRGVTAPVVSGWCYALPECPGTDVYYTVPVDGSPVESGSRSTLASVLLPGILFFGPCPAEEGADCYGAPLHYQPATGQEQVLVAEHLVKAFAWLP
jgi:hypothetical protein